MVENNLSPWARVLFTVLLLVGVGLLMVCDFAFDTGPAVLHRAQAWALGGHYVPMLSYLVLALPVMAVAAGLAFLLDFVSGQGQFDPARQEREERARQQALARSVPPGSLVRPPDDEGPLPPSDNVGEGPLRPV